MESLVKKPLGESKLGKGFGPNWNNCHRGVNGPIICEICGTEHPERKNETYLISIFLGREVVEECCGKILDLVYEESGKQFTEAYLTDFSENPTAPEFYFLMDFIKNILIKIREKLGSNKREVDETLQQLSRI